MATTGASDGISVRPRRALEPRLPELVMLVTPPVPFWTASAMPFRLLRFTPSTPLVPFMMSVFVTLTVLAAALPIEVPLDRRLPIPRSEGSIVPLLLSVTLFPVRLIAVPSKPSSTPALAPGFTLTVKLFAALEKLGASKFAAPAQVTVEPLVVQAAQAAGLSARYRQAIASANTSGFGIPTPEALPPRPLSNASCPKDEASEPCTRTLRPERPLPLLFASSDATTNAPCDLLQTTR